MKPINRILVLAALASIPLASVAQFDTGSGRTSSTQSSSSSKPWTDLIKGNKKTLQLNFRNANVDLVLDLYMKASGITIIKDPNLKDSITLSSPKAVPLDQAFEILSAALGVRNFEIQKQGSLLVIKKKEERREQSQGFDMSALAGMIGNSQSQAELKVYPIKYAAASQVAETLNNVFEMEAQQSNPFAMMFGGGRTQRGGRGGGFNPASMFGGQQSGSSVRAAADDYSNSLIVFAPRDKQRSVEDLIEQIDKQTDQPVKTRTYQLEFADATSLSSTIQTALNGQPTTGRGAQQANTSRNQNQGRGGFFGFFGGGNNNQNTNVAPDVRSNSLIVTTTEENHNVVAQLVEELDKEVPLENNTFVIPLNNARADSVATLLQGAFGNRSGTSTNRTTNTNNRSTTNNRNTNNRNNTNQGRVSEDGQSLELDFDEFAGDDGELYTQVRTGQNFGQRNTGQTQNQGGGLVRGQDGRLTNVRDLSGGVTIIPDTNTNSLIVVTDPANLEILQQILGQLDKIPEQVMIETIIVEATLDNSLKLGVEWNYVQEKAFGQSGVTGSANTNFGLQSSNPQGFRYTLSGGNVTAFMNALATDDKFQVLSTPRIFTSNNVEAEINISQSVPYVLSTREDNNGNLTFNYAFQDVGIVLNVVPQISANGMVTLDVVQTANDLQGFTDFNAPIVNQRQAQTTVSVKDGDTIVLGGIMRNTVTSNVKKLPLLGDIPLLGELFKTRTRQNTKTELLVFLTPRVVKNPDDAAKLREDETNRLSPASQKTIKGAVKTPDKQGSTGGIKSGPKQPGKGN